MRRSLQAARLLALGGAASFAAMLAATKAGRIESRSGLLGAVAVSVFMGSAASLAGTLSAWGAPEGRWRRRAEAAIFAGLLLASGTGLVRVALDFSGVVVLTEGEAIDMEAGRGLQAFDAGPMARPRILSGQLVLARLKLRPDPRLGTAATSLLERVAADGRRESFEVATGRGASVGGLAFQQGAFGFAPRLVVRKGDLTVVDRTVYFTSRVSPVDGGVVFEGELEVPGGGPRVIAGIDLSELDDAMRGHPVLVAEVRQGDEVLGGGRLLPGHGATMKGGWHLGFAGVKMWSEVDVHRAGTNLPLIAGLVLGVLGMLLWPIAAWRRW